MTNGICGNEFQPPLRGYSRFAFLPAVETAGYCQMSLRDEANAKPLVEKLESWMKFKSQTPLREII